MTSLISNQFILGAMSVALGTGAAGVFSNDDELWNYLTMVSSIYFIKYKLYVTLCQLELYLTKSLNPEKEICYMENFLEIHLLKYFKFINTKCY